jgi:hypothetical protein
MRKPRSSFGFTPRELRVLRRLNTPVKIQDFLAELPFNDEPNGETCMSPRRVLQAGKAHCMEGAMLAAAALRMHGHRPLIVDLCSTYVDDDHEIALFGGPGRWGAISKTGSPVLRYREPIYRTVRELMMSYFHEYFMNNGKKTLRTYSVPVDLSRFDKRGWMTAEDELWDIANYMTDATHYRILTQGQIARLRKADPIEIKAGRMQEK